ncbi:UDP-N-acetylmuramoyl-tripeptide--D-alanyl-D-alanine ligase [Neolewinella antarctica]|uniref:UDP-N-acetylmuramoyl-tripeptide--D-alanyl-D-alanine ligase n=1 Tax=Neolewinella antarctica TaxID=442734 RepID=A0ABX0XBD0_9BACT|nr:UDP-N-acetylmuramoyl-tripeptide--D-alanyl-D-alanine ligase [Neolewinella antarctica]NJC26581.1 UDP-N-acetylmuramoyl-tripeptide--D-alanyl-D-alanine ligase [Neolewinella antarctica]
MKYTSEARLYEIYRQHPRVRIDSRSVEPGDLFVGLVGTQVNGNAYADKALTRGAGFVIVDDPTVVVAGDERFLLVPDSLVALQGMAISHRKNQRMPALAITGSNGKTTTKELARAVLARQYTVHATPGNYNNHLGLPLTVLGTPKGADILVLEMGANHQGEVAELCMIGRPTHGLITNIGEAHLEGFGGIAGVIAGKGELFDYLSTNRGVAFVNANEDYLSEMASKNGRVIYFQDSEVPDQEVAAIEIKVFSVHPRIHVGFLSSTGELIEAKLNLSGQHNLQNVKAAICIGKYFKVPALDIAAALRAYEPTNHRSQYLETGAVTFFWDAYNANPSSVVAAMESFSANHKPADSVVILGEMLELGPIAGVAHREVAFQAGKAADTVVFVGEAMREPAREFQRPWFADSFGLTDWFWQQDWSGRTVFVKGSRGNKLERILQGAPVSQ